MTLHDMIRDVVAAKFPCFVRTRHFSLVTRDMCFILLLLLVWPPSLRWSVSAFKIILVCRLHHISSFIQWIWSKTTVDNVAILPLDFAIWWHATLVCSSIKSGTIYMREVYCLALFLSIIRVQSASPRFRQFIAPY